MTNLAKLSDLQIKKHGTDRYPTIRGQFIKLTEEIGELGKEINRSRRSTDLIAGEAADAVLCLYRLARKLNFDLDKAVEDKVKGDNRVFATNGRPIVKRSSKNIKASAAKKAPRKKATK